MTLIVKIGGASGVATEKFVREIATYVASDRRVVLVHGGSD